LAAKCRVETRPTSSYLIYVEFVFSVAFLEFIYLHTSSLPNDELKSALDSSRRLQRMIEVFEDVFDILDADGQPNAFRCDANLALLFFR
jgi:hypothetical protein